MCSPAPLENVPTLLQRHQGPHQRVRHQGCLPQGHHWSRQLGCADHEWPWVNCCRVILLFMRCDKHYSVATKISRRIINIGSVTVIKWSSLCPVHHMSVCSRLRWDLFMFLCYYLNIALPNQLNPIHEMYIVQLIPSIIPNILPLLELKLENSCCRYCQMLKLIFPLLLPTVCLAFTWQQVLDWLLLEKRIPRDFDCLKFLKI